MRIRCIWDWRAARAQTSLHIWPNNTEIYSQRLIHKVLAYFSSVDPFAGIQLYLNIVSCTMQSFILEHVVKLRQKIW